MNISTQSVCDMHIIMHMTCKNMSYVHNNMQCNVSVYIDAGSLGADAVMSTLVPLRGGKAPTS